MKSSNYKIVWYHPSVVFEKPYARTLREAREVANEMLHTKLPVVRPLGANILRRTVAKVRGVKFIDWVPFEALGSVPA